MRERGSDRLCVESRPPARKTTKTRQSRALCANLNRPIRCARASCVERALFRAREPRAPARKPGAFPDKQEREGEGGRRARERAARPAEDPSSPHREALTRPRPTGARGRFRRSSRPGGRRMPGSPARGRVWGWGLATAVSKNTRSGALCVFSHTRMKWGSGTGARAHCRVRRMQFVRLRRGGALCGEQKSRARPAEAETWVVDDDLVEERGLPTGEQGSSFLFSSRPAPPRCKTRGIGQLRTGNRSDDP